MTLKYRVTFDDGSEATMLDPDEKPLPDIQASILGRFGRSRVKQIERDSPNTEPPDDGGFSFPGG
jgi:hypothetical protein